MENDINSNLTKNELENIFKLDYENQKLENNIEYEKWKDSIKNNYGNDVIIFRCLEDNILFSNENNNSNSFYFIKCPICNNFTCSYCSYSSKYEDEHIMCCFKRVISTIFKYKASKYVEKEYKKNCENIIILIPGCNFYIIYFNICVVILCYLASKESKQKKEKFKIHDFFSSKNFLSIFVLIGLLLVIPFFILNIIVIIFIILISIPFQFYPIKFLAGIFHSV